MLRIIIALFVCAFLNAQTVQVENFPQINQGEIRGAGNRCGSIALGSWFLWFGGNGYPEFLNFNESETNNPFQDAALSPHARSLSSKVDQQSGGSGEIRLYTLVKSAVRFIHEVPGQPIEAAIHNYNLPDTSLLRALIDNGAATILLYGIYDEDRTSGVLKRVRGHYTCLLGATDSALIANTYAENYQFTLEAIPMQQLRAKDRYRPTGTESFMIRQVPAEAFPNYTFRSFAPRDSKRALKQTTLRGPHFAKHREVILLESALAIWFERTDNDEN